MPTKALIDHQNIVFAIYASTPDTEEAINNVLKRYPALRTIKICPQAPLNVNDTLVIWNNIPIKEEEAFQEVLEHIYQNLNTLIKEPQTQQKFLKLLKKERINKRKNFRFTTSKKNAIQYIVDCLTGKRYKYTKKKKAAAK